MIEQLLYINDKPVRFAGIYDPVELSPEEEGYQVVSEEAISLERAIINLEKNKSWKGLVYLSNAPQRSRERLMQLFVLIEAAGGLVRNEDGAYLMIFRRGKWDLPKGKIDYDESPEEAAVREVKEECGIQDLEVVRSLAPTFHSYPQDGKRMLKKTHWYLMRCEKDQNLVPQADEDIEKVEWMTEAEIRKAVYPSTFFSVRCLLESFFKNH